MRTILCYGDSNTWGYVPGTGERYPLEVRWTGALKAFLGDDYYVIEEGLNGRTTVWDDPLEDYRNGKDALVPCLFSHAPLDLVILMLGSNDLKTRFNASAFDIARGAGILLEIIQNSTTGRNGGPPEILLIAPPMISPVPGSDVDIDMADGEGKSREFGKYFQRIAREAGCAYLESSGVISVSPVDGLYLDPYAHRKLAQAVGEIILGTSR